MFSLVGCLSSMPSAGGCPPLFGHFDGNTQPSDSPSAYMLDSWLGIVDADGRALIDGVVADIAQPQYRVGHELLFNREIPIVHHGIHQIRVDPCAREAAASQ